MEFQCCSTMWGIFCALLAAEIFGRPHSGAEEPGFRGVSAVDRVMCEGRAEER